MFKHHKRKRKETYPGVVDLDKLKKLIIYVTYILFGKRRFKRSKADTSGFRKRA